MLMQARVGLLLCLKEATAKLLTWKEFLAEEMKVQCDFEKRTLVLDSELVIENVQITLDETRVRYQVEIDTRDEEIETLRDIIKKNTSPLSSRDRHTRQRNRNFARHY